MHYYPLLTPLAYRPNIAAYLLNDEFWTPAIPSLATPRTAEPGPGVLTLSQTDGVFAIGQDQKLWVYPHTTPAWGDQGLTAQSMTRIAGRSLSGVFRYLATGNSVFGWSTTPTLGGGGAPEISHGFQPAGGIIYKNQAVGGQQLTPSAAFVINSDYTWYVVLQTIGALYYANFGRSATLLWVDTGISTTPMYPSLNINSIAASIDNLRVRDLGGNFATDYGWASVNVTGFTQSVGAELLTNSDFSSWSGNNPTGWSVAGEVGADPAVSEVAPGGGAGTGAAQYISSATGFAPALSQSVLTVGGIYEVGLNVTAYTSGNIQILDGGAGWNVIYASTGVRRTLQRAGNAIFNIRSHAATPASFVIDDTTVKRITLNPAVTTPADAVHLLEFTLPASPIAGQEVHLLYRMPSAGDEFLNGWDAYLRRNDGNTAWDMRLDSIAAGTRTNRIAATSVGTPDGFVVIVDGINHNVYTRASNVWTQRGSTISVSLYNAATGANVIASTGFTVTRFASGARRSAAVDSVLVPSNYSYSHRDQFYTSRDAPLGSTRNAEPAGVFNITDTNNRLSVNGGALQIAAATYAIGDPRYLTDILTRQTGKAVLVTLTPATLANLFGVGFTAGTTISSGLYFVNSGEIRAPDLTVSVTNVGVFAANTAYEVAVVLLSTGFLAFIRGGAYLQWTLLWHGTGDNSNLAAGITAMAAAAGGGAAMPVIRVVDLPAPYNTDTGLDLINVTAFTQAAGSELVSNGNMEAGSPPTGWSSANGAVLSAAADERTGGSGVQSISIASTVNPQPFARQNVVTTSGGIHEFSLWRRIVTADSTAVGIVQVSPRTVIGTFPALVSTSSSWVQATTLFRANDALTEIGLTVTDASVSGDTGRFDDVSVKSLTLNTQRQISPDAEITADFTLPVSPIAGQEFHLLYRIPSIGEEFLNGWDAYLRRNDAGSAWDVRLDSIVAGTRTNRIAVTGIGNTDAIRVIVRGSSHDLYTRSSTTWTKRGSTITAALFNAATGVNTIYSTGFTAGRLRAKAVAQTISPTAAINKTTFEQSIGAELLVNPDFTAWTGDNPDSWTVVGEVGSDPMVTQVASGGGAGTGAARLFSSATSSAPTVRQNILTAGTYEFEVDVSARTSGTLELIGVDANFVRSYTSVGVRKSLGRINSSGNFVLRGGTAPSDFVINSASVKLITLTTAQPALPQGLFELTYTLPASPIAGQSIELRYRYVDANNYFGARLIRSDGNVQWNASLFKVIAGVETALIGSVASGTPDSLRVQVINDLHTLQTGAAGVWTHRGTPATDTNLNYAVGMTEVHNTGFTPTALNFYPLIDAYSLLGEV